MSLTQVQNPAEEHSLGAELPAPPLRIALGVVIALIAGIGLARWLERGDAHTVPAFLRVRTVSVTADRSGRLVEFLVEEGDRITVGDQLLVLADTDLEDKVLQAAENIKILEQQFAQAEAQANYQLAIQRQELDEKICQIRLKSAEYLKQQYDHELRKNMLADRMAMHESALWDAEDLLIQSLSLESRWPDSDRIATVHQMEVAANAAEVSAAQVELCEERVEALKRTSESLSTYIRESCGVELVKTQLEAARSEMKRLEERQSRLTLCSDAVGQVGVFRHRPGDHVRPGEPIVELLDDSQRYLEAFVPSRRIQEFQVGNEVLLTFPGQEKRRGRIVRIAPQVKPDSSAHDFSDPVVPVEIEQAGRLWPVVPIGTRIDVAPEKPL